MKVSTVTKRCGMKRGDLHYPIDESLCYACFEWASTYFTKLVRFWAERKK